MKSPPTEPDHFISKAYLEALLAPLSGANHAPLTVEQSASMELLLQSGTQELRATVRRKTSGLESGEGLILETVAGLAVSLGSGANQAAKGSDLGDLVVVVAGKAAAVHTHAISDVTDLQTALNAKAALAHGHIIGDITGLQLALDGKAAVDHVHGIGGIDGLSDALNAKAGISSTWEISQVNGLQPALDLKSNFGHTHVFDDVPGLSDALTGKAAVVHAHDAATQELAGFMSAADKVKLDEISGNEHWRESVSVFSNLPVNTDPIGTVRLVRGEHIAYECVATVGQRAEQWKQMGGSVRKFSAWVGDGITTVIDTVHSLGTKEITFSYRDLATDEFLLVQGFALTENIVRLVFGEAPPMSGGKLVVMG